MYVVYHSRQILLQFCVTHLVDLPPCHHHHVDIGIIHSQITVKSPHAPFRLVSPYCITIFLPSNKSNTTGLVVLLLVTHYQYGDTWRVDASSFVEYLRYIRRGLDRLHKLLNSEALTTFCATTCEHCTTALRGHTRTETMALCTFTSVRLICAFHCYTLSNP